MGGQPSLMNDDVLVERVRNKSTEKNPGWTQPKPFEY